MPRNKTYSYYSLADVYLKQGETEKAITALTLQSIIEPQFFISALWQTEPYQTLQPQVLAKSLTLFETLVEQLPPEDFLVPYLQQVITIAQWWYNQPVTAEQIQTLFPLQKALLLAENAPEEALKIVEENLAKEPQSIPFSLLGAWLKPQDYVDDYIQADDNLTESDRNGILQHLRQHRDLKEWLVSLPPESLGERGRVALIYTYHNRDLVGIGRVLMPEELQFHVIPRFLKLLPNFYPREFIPLEQLINQVRRDELQLPHPTENQFQL